MMVHRLRERAHLVDERERLGEIAERPGALDRVARARPTGDLAEAGRNLVLGEKGSPRHERGKDHGGKRLAPLKLTLFKVNMGHPLGPPSWATARSRSGSARGCRIPRRCRGPPGGYSCNMNKSRGSSMRHPPGSESRT